MALREQARAQSRPLIARPARAPNAHRARRQKSIRPDWRRPQLTPMVNLAFPLAHINLMFALLTRVLVLFGLGPKPPKPLLRALIFAEAALAGVSRANLREDGVAFPDFDDAQLIVWCNRNNPCSDRSPSAVREKAIAPRPKNDGHHKHITTARA